MKLGFALKTLTILTAIGLGILLGRAVQSKASNPSPPRRTFTWGTSFLRFPGVDARESLVSPKPGVLVVDAECRFLNPMATQPFRWVLTVRDMATKKVVGETVYEHQAFVVPRGATVTPTFHEEVPAPPGRYLVSLKLKSSSNLTGIDGKIEEYGMSLLTSTFYETVR